MDLRARILGNQDGRQPAAIVDVVEWGERVGLRRLSLHERLQFELDNGAFESLDRKSDPRKYSEWLVRYVIATAVTPEGERLFAPEDEFALGAKSANALERLALVALRSNIVTADEIRDLGNVSGEATNGASPSDSPVISA
jgi:hypothetical protein